MEENNASKSLISKEMKITGTIESSGSLQIDGKLDGELHCSGDTNIGKNAKIKGNLDANTLVVSGTVNGNITAKDKIEMKASARVTGDIKAKRLAVEDGVTFVGKSEVNPSGENVAPKQSDTQKGEQAQKGQDKTEKKGNTLQGKR